MRRLQRSQWAFKVSSWIGAMAMAMALSGAGAQQLTLQRGDATVVVQPYAPPYLST
jgi:hypothetical protein